MHLITFALMASTPVLARSTNSTRTPGSLLTAFNLSANVRIPNGSNDGVHVKRLPGDLKSTLGEERASVSLPKSSDQIVTKAVSRTVAAIYSHGQNLAWVPKSLKSRLKSLDSYAIHQYLKFLLSAPLSEHPHEKERQLIEIADTLLKQSMPAKNSLNDRNVFIFEVRKVISKIQQTVLHKSLDDLTSWMKAPVNTPGMLFKNLNIAVDAEWTKCDRVVNPFAAPYFEVLTKSVQMYNEKFSSTMKLLDAFIERYKGEAQVASMLSMARLSGIYGSDAVQMRHELFVRWVERGMTISGVAKLLVSTITSPKNLLHFKVIDPLKEYISLFSRQYSIPEEKTEKILQALKAKEFNLEALMIELEAAESEIGKLLTPTTDDIENYAQGLLMHSPQN